MRDVRVLVAVVLVVVLVGYKWHEERLRFVAGAVTVEGSDGSLFSGPVEVSSAPLDGGRRLVTAGPLTYRDQPRTLVLVLRPTPEGWRVENAGVYWTTDPPEGSRWIEPLRGEVRIDSSSTAPDATLRCEVDLWCDAVLEGRMSLEGSFEVAPGAEGEEGALEAGPFDARAWVGRIGETPLPER